MGRERAGQRAPSHIWWPYQCPQVRNMRLASCFASGVFLALCLPFVDVQKVDWMGILFTLTVFGFGLALGIDIGLMWSERIRQQQREMEQWLKTKQ